MPDDDDDLNDFKLPPGTNEDADQQLDKKALGMVKEYVASLTRSSNENTIRADIRGNIVKLGINGLSFQHELVAQKMMDAEDRRSYMAGRKRMAKIFAQEDGLFATEQAAVKERKAKRREREAKAAAAAGQESPEAQERRLAADSNPRSKPKSTSAVPPKKPGRKPKVVAGSAADRAVETSERKQREQAAKDASTGAAPGSGVDAEQTEGANVLDGMLASTKARSADETGKPISQSAQAAAVREQLGLDKA